MGDWFLEGYSVMTNFCVKVTNSIAKCQHSFANRMNSIVKATNSIAKTCNDNNSGEFVLPHSSFTRNQHKIHLNCSYVLTPWILIKSTPNLKYWYLPLDPQYVYKISVRLKYAYTSYSDLCFYALTELRYFFPKISVLLLKLLCFNSFNKVILFL